MNEVYLRLVDVDRVRWQNRAHFLAVAARLMRRVLVDFARSRRYQKRGGGGERVAFDEALVIDVGRGHDLLALDDALDELARVDARQSQIVVMRFFGGIDGRGDRQRPGHLRRHGDARLETREVMAAARARSHEAGAETVTVDRWERVGEIYHAALALADRERTRFSTTACGDDARTAARGGVAAGARRRCVRLSGNPRAAN